MTAGLNANGEMVLNNQTSTQQFSIPKHGHRMRLLDDGSLVAIVSQGGTVYRLETK